MSWAPINDHHAIESVRLAIAFNEAVPKKLGDSLRHAIQPNANSLGLTNVSERNGAMLQLGPGGFQGNPVNVIGWEFSSRDQNNRPIEMLSLENDTFAFQCSNYERWQPFIDRFQTLASESASKLLDVIEYRAVTLDYVDRFVFFGDPEHASPDFVAEKLRSVLSETAMNGRHLWHIHRGWFEELEDGFVLVNQNFDASNIQSDGVEHRSVSVLNRLELRSRVGDNFDDISAFVEHMHDRSKQLLARSLTKEMQDRIGLTGNFK